ncbi:MAG TPA: potassium channel protein [Solirubrobacteraceae bacterium]|nr:potassium channel protein [Solirubrobacteraceae bacterium]
MPIPVDRRRISHHQALERRRRARREREQFTRRLTILMAALAGVVVLGTIAFALTEGVSVPYGFVWTLDTVTTLGALKDPQDVTGRVVVVLLELFGIGTLFYGLATVAEFFVTGQLSGLREERRNQRMIDSYSDHFIICGFGRVGRQVARDLGLAGVKHVAIDANPSHREEAASLGVRYIESYAADDEVLISAGIMRARAVVACVDSDADNIFIVLTARGLRPDILIIARASAEDAERKLQRAGADRVISPYKTSGTEMARLALHPQVGGAVQVADYRMEEIEVSPSCEGVGKTIEQVRGDAVVVAVRHPDGRLEPQPAPASVVEAGQMLVAIGRPVALERLETAFQPVTVHAS